MKLFRFLMIFLLVSFGILTSCLKKDDSLNSVISQFEKDTTAIVKYLNDNSIPSAHLSQGVWFSFDSLGTGIRPVYSDSIKVKYSMKLLLGGTVVDQSSTPKHFVLDSLIGGIQLALPQFPVGSKGRIFIPSSLGYGAVANGNIPANSPLIFEFQLTQVNDYQLKIDTTVIDAYLSLHSINAIKQPNGLRYTIQTLGNGTTPAVTDQVLVNYTATTMSNNLTVDQGNSVSVDLSQLILGWQIGLELMQQGSTITLYVPSQLAYGPSGLRPQIVPYENMIFTITLNGVNHR